MKKILYLVILIFLVSCNNNNILIEKINVDTKLEDEIFSQLKKELTLYSSTNNYSVRRMRKEIASFEEYFDSTIVTAKESNIKDIVLKIDQYIDVHLYISSSAEKDYVTNLFSFWESNEILDKNNDLNEVLRRSVILDLKKIKSAIIRDYIKQFSNFGITFNTLRAGVIMDKYRINEGENVSFDIFIAGGPITGPPEISFQSDIKNIDTLRIDSATCIGSYRINNINKGNHILTGSISIKDMKGKKIYFPFETSIKVK